MMFFTITSTILSATVGQVRFTVKASDCLKVPLEKNILKLHQHKPDILQTSTGIIKVVILQNHEGSKSYFDVFVRFFLLISLTVICKKEKVNNHFRNKSLVKHKRLN